MFKKKLLKLWDIFLIFWTLSKLLRLLLNVTEITTEHQKRLKIRTNSVESSFFSEGQEASAKAKNPPQEL